ncbi:hypothetical protein [Lysinibacillus pakistanensis]|uniref:hypothetical protein n=1 Tax=Lysinibacillus pakistanensis TaxID=759811 RepID=UPI003D269BB5
MNTREEILESLETKDKTGVIPAINEIYRKAQKTVSTVNGISFNSEGIVEIKANDIICTRIKTKDFLSTLEYDNLKTTDSSELTQEILDKYIAENIAKGLVYGQHILMNMDVKPYYGFVMSKSGVTFTSGSTVLSEEAWTIATDQNEVIIINNEARIPFPYSIYTTQHVFSPSATEDVSIQKMLDDLAGTIKELVQTSNKEV